MTAVTRRIYEMCVRVLGLTGTHPDDEPGFVVLAAQLQALVTRMTAVIAEQREGLVDSRAATARKRQLRQEVLSGPIAHLARIGALAAREEHELGSTFRFKPTADTYLAFQVAARSMLAQAQTHKEVLVQHGLSESVLELFGKLMGEFDAANVLGSAGRTAHTAATRELDILTKEAALIVHAMDARNRLRFENDRQALEQWISASAVLGTPKDTPAAAPAPEGTPSAGGDVRPAA